jgi:NAD(P)-dependent dehydrogenase (short-subunit alcohol dehydrogenase family)
MTKLRDKVALITGGTRGIGRSVAEAFAREGARLFIAGHIDEAALQRTLSELRQTDAAAEGGLFDIGSEDEVRRLADAIARHFGTLDIVVNNAGSLVPTPLLELTSHQWATTI